MIECATPRQDIGVTSAVLSCSPAIDCPNSSPEIETNDANYDRSLERGPGRPHSTVIVLSAHEQTHVINPLIS